MTTVPASTQPRGSVQTEELSSKSIFGSESDDDSSGPQPQKNSSNGKVHKHKPHKEKGDKSETMVIFNPNHNFTTDSEKDDVKIVVCPDKNGKNNNSATAQITAEGEKSENKKNISSLLKSGGLFSHGGEKKKKRGSQKRRQDQREMRATIRMAIIIAFFCGCWIGFFTSYLVRGIVGEENFFMPRGLDAFFFWLGYSNSAMNPILYTIFNDDFRRAFQKILGCYTKRRHGNGPAYGKARS